MFTLPGLPSKEKFAAMLKTKEEDRRRLEKERELELERKRLERLRLERSKTQESQKRNSPRNSEIIKEPGHRKTDSVGSNKSLDMTNDTNSSTNIAAPTSSASNLLRTGTDKFKSWRKEAKPDFSAVSISKKADAGWGPVQVTMSTSPDPVTQQIEIIRGYMKQAKQDKRWEELRMFEENLKELELVYMEQRKEEGR